MMVMTVGMLLFKTDGPRSFGMINGLLVRQYRLRLHGRLIELTTIELIGFGEVTVVEFWCRRRARQEPS